MNTETSPEAITPTNADIAVAPKTDDVVTELPNNELLIVATNPDEMLQAQLNLIDWAANAKATAQKELTEYEALLAGAVQSKISQVPYKRLIAIAQGQIDYFNKMELLFRAGYFMVPEFPMNLIAIRTKRLSPKTREQVKRWNTDHHAVPSEHLPAGIGEYVSSSALCREWDVEEKRADNSTRKTRMIEQYGYDKISPPVAFMRPKLLNALDQALQAKVFDEIGILLPQRPAAPHRGAPIRTIQPNPDPMLFGTITRKETGNKIFRTQFLIAWWIDTKTIA